MQSNPPSDKTPVGPGNTLPSEAGDQGIPGNPLPASEDLGGYPEPVYRESAPGISSAGLPKASVPVTPDASPFAGAQAFGAPSVPGAPPVYSTSVPGIPVQPGVPMPTGQVSYVPPISQPGDVTSPFQPGSVPPALPPGYTFPVSQPGYIPPTPPPGYFPPTPQPGYVTSTLPPGYVPPTYPPGYFPPPQPGYVPPVPPRRKLDAWAIGSIILVVILLLGGAIAGIAVIAHNKNSTVTAQTPTAQPTVCSGSLASCYTPGTTVPSSPIHPTSAFQSAPCPFTVGTGLTEGKEVTCGYVTVPENRAANDGKTVKLAVAIFRGQQYMNSPDPNPILRLDGGPGGTSLDNVAIAINASNYNQFVFDHDQIMFDQRGVGYSTPSLKCPELTQLQDASMSGGQQTYEQAAQACYNRLTSQGIDLNGFNSIQDAGDVNDLIHALGYKQMTIYGVSYGTRLALTVMRLYPSAVHAAVLDSTYPPNHNRNDLPSDAQRVFNVFFQGCAKDPTCSTKYPNLQSTFYSLADTLNTTPITFNTADPTTGQQYTVTFAGDDLVGFLFSGFYVTQLIPMLPMLILQIKEHNYTQFAPIYGALTFDDSFSDGTFYSTECSEDWPYLTQQDITTSEQGIDPHIVKVFGADEEQEYTVCQFWKVQKLPSAQKQPVVSNLPTLVVAGEYDPITPPGNGQEAAKTLSHSYFFLFPGQGHGQEYSSNCSNQIINAFEDNPNQQPDGSCINQMTEPAFQ